MSAVGRWDITLATPVGPQSMELTVVSRDGGFSGRVDGAMGGYDVSGSLKGQTVSFVLAVKKPIPVKVTFELVVDGDTISGHAKAGLFGKAVVEGRRLHEDAPRLVTTTTGLVTADSADPMLREPFIELDEQRSEPAPHRYVHGGFRGTDARFSFYFPPREQYRGRFFHNTYPLARSSDVGPFPIAFDVATGDLAFTFDSGAYYVQTNLGGTDGAPPADPSIAAYRVNAAAAKYSRKLAAEMYGPRCAYGYLFGGSGGSYQVMGSAENTVGVWDGFLPFVLATPNAIPSLFSVRMHALRVLRRRNKLPEIYDAICPGGSGDPYAGLNDEESAALREVTQLGFPLRGFWNHAELGSGYFAKVAGMVPMLDPSYLDDFWSKPGYLGANREDSIHAERFTFETRVTKVLEGTPKRVELSRVPERDFNDAHLVLLSGAAAGKSASLVDIDGNTAAFSISADPSVVAAVRGGDSARLDNSWALALQTYQRHQLPDATMYGWDQYRDADGQPKYPQRELLVGPVGTAATAGCVPEGLIQGKVLALQCLMDIDALAWQADWYRSTVKAALGERFVEQFALWFIDHAQHDNPTGVAARAHTINFSGALQQALRDLACWVEEGIRPADTRYRIAGAQVVVSEDAGERGGIQPLVELQVNGGPRADVRVGDVVTFSAKLEVPPGAGAIVAAEWDFEGIGTFSFSIDIGAPRPSVHVSATHRFDRQGTYFPVLRAVSQRDGDTQTRFTRVENIGRARVVVA